jgi:L1 cell adhesion molecule like protein
MADIVVRDLERIVKVALAIKKAVETAKQNKEDCVKIGERAAEVSTHMKWLKENSKAMEDPSMSDTLKSMEETLERALKLVNECQRKHVVLRYFNASGMSKKLHQVQDDISYKLWNGVLATVIDTRIALEKQIQSAIDTPLHQHQQVTLVLLISNFTK